MKNKPDFDNLRTRMVKNQLEKRAIRSQPVLEAMRLIPRHLFVPPDERYAAYEDRPLLIGECQTISQPYIVALMSQLLQLQGEERVLEIGTGSGYQAAVLAHLAAEVYSVEKHKSLAGRAAKTLKDLKYDNVHIRCADGSLGWPEHAPYQGILVTAAAPSVPQPLLEQLDVGGKLVLPVGGRLGQNLQVWRRHASGYTHDDIVPVAFVPLRGEHGWDQKEWKRP
jgi:protein-L-isoaspartate(D-aspartate) O-methyltransferase